MSEPAQTRKFGGKTYHSAFTSMDKKHASQVAEALRARGFSIRLVRWQEVARIQRPGQWAVFASPSAHGKATTAAIAEARKKHWRDWGAFI